MTGAHADEGMYETFNPITFIIGILASAGLLLILPIGFIFHPAPLLYAALAATALFFVVVFKITATPKA